MQPQAKHVNGRSPQSAKFPFTGKQAAQSREGDKASLVIREAVITPTEAARLMETSNTHNRPMSDAHVAKLSRSMKEGRWKLNGQAIKIARSGKILDGQHRLWACVMAEVPFATLVVTGLEEDCFESLAEEKARSSGDVFGYHGVKNSNQVSAAVVMLYFHLGIGLDCIGNAAYYPTREEVWDLYQKHSAVSNFANVPKGLRSLFSPSAINFFWYVFDGIDRKLAADFFEQLQYGVGKNETSPVYHLRRRLETDRNSRAKLPRIEKMAIFIKAWNLHLAGAPTRLLRWSNDEGFPEISKVVR